MTEPCDPYKKVYVQLDSPLYPLIMYKFNYSKKILNFLPKLET